MAKRELSPNQMTQEEALSNIKIVMHSIELGIQTALKVLEKAKSFAAVAE